MKSNIKVLHPKIWVFQNEFANSQNLINYLESKQEDWTDWYTFGSKIQLYLQEYSAKSFPTEEEWEKTVILHEWDKNKFDENAKQILTSFLRTFHSVTKQYVKSVGIEIDNWVFAGTDACKYFAKGGVSEIQAMNYHTDYRLGRARFPGRKFEITCVFYLNGDYDGGEISFKIFNDDLTKLLEVIDYKPSTGDIIIFPSKHPFYHGVRAITEGMKYIVRTYWRYDEDGDPELLRQKEKFLQSHTEEEWERLAQDKENELWNRYQLKIDLASSNSETDENILNKVRSLSIDPYSIVYE